MEINFSKEQIKEAIKTIDKNPDLRKGRESQKYDLIHNNESYPPILVLSVANKLNRGNGLTLSDFSNSIDKPFRILRNNGFMIKEKNEETVDFTPTISKYLKQVKTSNLKTANYKNEFKGLTVKVSFGQGIPTHVPWISFLGEGQSTSKGIYPVFLYYKDQNVLVLAYGISETNDPDYEWDLDDPKTIADLFEQKNWDKPYRYGSSFVYSYYNLNNSFIKTEINKDLNQLVDYYKEFLSSTTSTKKQVEISSFTEFTEASKRANLHYTSKLCNRFIYSLCTKPFLILTGLSGSGKTKIAQAFTSWISESNNQINIVSVGADWTNREPLLGYPNALEHKQYVLPDSGVLQLLINAQNNPAHPYFLILDEMNLSHVERYFADFLSAMESGEKIHLHSGEIEWNGVPPSIKIPPNLFVIGTVNIDETTYMFSPKVLDRANVIEFRIEAGEIETFLQNPNDIDLKTIKGEGAPMAKHFVQISKNSVPKANKEEQLNKELLNFFKELKKVGAEFGYRSAYEIHRLAGIANSMAEDWTIREIIDIAVVQKLLPKLHGSRRKLEPILETLATLCADDNKKTEEALSIPHEFDFNDPGVKYPISLEKIARMHKRLLKNGFTSFAEA